MRLQTRLILAIGYVLLVALIAFLVPLAINYRERTDSEVRAQASGHGDLLAVTAAEDLREGPGQLRPLVDVAAETVRGRVLIVGANGRSIADSGGTRSGTDYANRPEIESALGGEKVQLERGSASLGDDLIATAVPIVEEDGEVLGAVRITQSVDAVDRAADRSLLGLALIAGVVLAIGLTAAVFVARQMARPIQSLTRSAERIAGGDLSERAAVAGSAEQRTLSRAFNGMTDRLAAVLRRQREFIADASHQLRTPLTGLRLRLEEARARSTDPAIDRELDAGERDLARLTGIVDDLLLLGRLGERDAPPAATDLAGLAVEAGDRWSRDAEQRGVELATVGDGPVLAWCPPDDAEHVIDAVVENAIIYGGDQVTIQVGPGRTIEVLDRGPGLGPDDAERVFERFHRGSAGRRVEGGSGLGLTIARALAREWGGDVRLEDRDGGGARAVISFPPIPEGARMVAGS